MTSGCIALDPHTIWIAGAGKSGLRAAESASTIWPGAELHLIDPQCQAAHSFTGHIHREDAVKFLVTHLNEEQFPDIIIPCAPVHLAFEWLSYHIDGGQKIPVPEYVSELLPNVMRAKDGGVYTSLADFFCPDNCPEPEHHCFKTGQARPYNLYEYLAALGNDTSYALVIRSYQIAPGIGGYVPQQLFNARKIIQEQTHQQFFISTSCKCHAVLHCLQMP